MCGMPYHSARGYIEKLVKAGWRVAICDQVGEVQAGKLVRRELSQIVSAGTLDDFGLDERKPNYLAAICKGADGHWHRILRTEHGRISRVGNHRPRWRDG